jgi:hypothetical protein
MLKNLKITLKVKYAKILETKKFLFQTNPLLQNNYPIIEKKFIPYDLMEHYLSSFCKKNLKIFSLY